MFGIELGDLLGVSCVHCGNSVYGADVDLLVDALRSHFERCEDRPTEEGGMTLAQFNEQLPKIQAIVDTRDTATYN